MAALSVCVARKIQEVVLEVEMLLVVFRKTYGKANIHNTAQSHRFITILHIRQCS